MRRPVPRLHPDMDCPKCGNPADGVEVPMTLLEAVPEGDPVLRHRCTARGCSAWYWIFAHAFNRRTAGV